MKNSALLLALMCVLGACGQKKSPPTGESTVNSSQAQKTADAKVTLDGTPLIPSVSQLGLPSTDVVCAMPAAFTAADQAGDVIGLIDHLKGSYQIEKLQVYGQKKGAEGISSLSASVDFSDDRKRNVTFKIECDDFHKTDLMTINTLIMAKIYTPSGAVTDYDSGDRRDNDQNFATLAEVRLGSNGLASVKETRGTATALNFRSYRDVLATLPANQKIMPRADGKEGFQILYSDLTVQYSRVLVTFGRQ